MWAAALRWRVAAWPCALTMLVAVPIGSWAMCAQNSCVSAVWSMEQVATLGGRQRAVSVVDSQAYIAMDEHLVILDVTDPADVTPVLSGNRFFVAGEKALEVVQGMYVFSVGRGLA